MKFIACRSVSFGSQCRGGIGWVAGNVSAVGAYARPERESKFTTWRATKQINSAKKTVVRHYFDYFKQYVPKIKCGRCANRMLVVEQPAIK